MEYIFMKRTKLSITFHLEYFFEESDTYIIDVPKLFMYAPNNFKLFFPLQTIISMEQYQFL